MVPAVGVNGVQMEVAAIPRGAPSGNNRRCGRDWVRNRLWRTAFQNHARLPTHAQRVEHHRAEGQRPTPGVNAACQVARRRVGCRQGET